MLQDCEWIIDYFNHQLNVEEYKRFEHHLDSCLLCREELDEFLVEHTLPGRERLLFWSHNRWSWE